MITPTEKVDIVGVKNGIETNLGKIPMPPSMKLKEIMRTYFSGSTDDEESEVSMAVAAGTELLAWMESQGYAIQTPSEPVAKLWVHPGVGMNGVRLHSVKVLDWGQLPAEGYVDLHLGATHEAPQKQ